MHDRHTNALFGGIQSYKSRFGAAINLNGPAYCSRTPSDIIRALRPKHDPYIYLKKRNRTHLVLESTQAPASRRLPRVRKHTESSFSTPPSFTASPRHCTDDIHEKHVSCCLLINMTRNVFHKDTIFRGGACVWIFFSWGLVRAFVATCHDCDYLFIICWVETRATSFCVVL